MATGKPIIAAIDGCCPDNEVRAKIGFKVTEAYKARMRSNLEAIQSYGITLTVDKNLFKKVNKVFTASFDFPIPSSDSSPEPENVKETKAEPACGCAAAAMETSSSIKLNKKVIGRVDIAKNAKYKTIIVGADSLVTGLADDEAYNRGITIVRE